MLERRRREAREARAAGAIEGRGHVEDVVPALRADLRERVGDAVSLDIGVAATLARVVTAPWITRSAADACKSARPGRASGRSAAAPS